MRILIGYNGSESSSAALDDLMEMGLPEQTEALVLTVAEASFASVKRDDAASLAANAATRVQSKFPGWTVTSNSVLGAPAKEIVARADTYRPDIIVVGECRQSRTEHNMFLGPVSQGVITEAVCSVRIARRGSGSAGALRLVVGFDGSAGAEFAIASIMSRKWMPGTSVSLLSVADSQVLGSIGRFVPQMATASFAAKYASQWAETLAAESLIKLRDVGLEASVEVRTGSPKIEIVEFANEWKADCVFVGPHYAGNSFERFLLGSVSADVAAWASCSVEVVRKPPEH